MKVTAQEVKRYLAAAPLLRGGMDDLIVQEHNKRIWRSTGESREITIEKIGPRGWHTVTQFNPNAYV